MILGAVFPFLVVDSVMVDVDLVGVALGADFCLLLCLTFVLSAVVGGGAIVAARLTTGIGEPTHPADFPNSITISL